MILLIFRRARPLVVEVDSRPLSGRDPEPAAGAGQAARRLVRTGSVFDLPDVAGVLPLGPALGTADAVIPEIGTGRGSRCLLRKLRKAETSGLNGMPALAAPQASPCDHLPHIRPMDVDLNWMRPRPRSFHSAGERATMASSACTHSRRTYLRCSLIVVPFSSSMKIWPLRRSYCSSSRNCVSKFLSS